jgi:hypothetical protein
LKWSLWQGGEDISFGYKEFLHYKLQIPTETNEDNRDKHIIFIHKSILCDVQVSFVFIVQYECIYAK